MEEAAESGKESLLSAHANGMNEWNSILQACQTSCSQLARSSGYWDNMAILNEY